MSEHKTTSKLKVGELLADFFAKNMTKESEKSAHSRKLKKHKRKSKKKHRHSHSSSSSESSKCHQSEERLHQSRSRSSERKRKRKFQHKHQSKSVERTSRKKKRNNHQSDSEDEFSEEWVESTTTIPSFPESKISSLADNSGKMSPEPPAAEENKYIKCNTSSTDTEEKATKLAPNVEVQDKTVTCNNCKTEVTELAQNTTVGATNSENSDVSQNCKTPVDLLPKGTPEHAFAEAEEIVLTKSLNKSSLGNLLNNHQKLKVANSELLGEQPDKAVITDISSKQKLSVSKQRELIEKILKANGPSTTKQKKHGDRVASGASAEKHRSSKVSSNKYDRASRSSHDRKISEVSDRKRKRSHSRSRERKPRSVEGNVQIDKEKLLEVARRKALEMMEKGTLPQGIRTEIWKKSQLSLKAGGKSVKELTDFCKHLSSKENDVDEVGTKVGQEETEEPFIHHPFKVKESSVIKLNIKNSVQLPVKSHAEKVTENARILSLQFPVSSGNQHRQKEMEWVPVDRSEPSTAQDTPVQVPQNAQALVPPETSDATQQLSPVLDVVSLAAQLNAPPPPPPPPPPLPPPAASPLVFPHLGQSSMLAVAPPSPACLYQTWPFSSRNSFYSNKPIDVHSIVSKRFNALVKLNQDPNDTRAAKDINDADMQIQAWVESQQLPGQFTGSTNAKVLSAEQLCGPRPAWVKKDVFSKAAPVMGGKGLNLLQKMGWKPGEGLGKNKDGSLEPLVLDFKMDKKGLVSEEEGGKWNKAQHAALLDLSNKHPVSCLMEICSKKKWEPPLYTVVKESGPPHKKMFIFKVLVNNKEFQPTVARQNKKQAKADAALLCLQMLQLVPPGCKMSS